MDQDRSSPTQSRPVVDETGAQTGQPYPQAGQSSSQTGQSYPQTSQPYSQTGQPPHHQGSQSYPRTGQSYLQTSQHRSPIGQPPRPPETHRRRSLPLLTTKSNLVTAAVTLGLGALAGLAASTYVGSSSPQAKRQSDIPRLPDDAPGRTAKQASFGDYKVTGRSVTINRPREEIYAFWRDFRNLARFMENIQNAREVESGLTVWDIRAPLGMTMQVKSRIVNEREGEQIAWRSTADSEIETEGKVTFRDAPGGRGTIVEAHVAYKPPMGALGQALAKVFSAEPSVQSRRDLKRLKMLLETGEIATNANRTGKGGKFQKAVRKEIKASTAV